MARVREWMSVASFGSSRFSVSVRTSQNTGCAPRRTKAWAVGPKGTATQSGAEVPTCKSEGIAIDQYQQPRTLWLPKNVSADVVAYYVGVLSKVRATPEWKQYIERSAQTDQFLTGAELKSFIADNDQKSRKVFEQEGWLTH